MATELALQPDLHVIENELRRIAQVIVPRDERIAHVDVRLAQNPVGERRVIAHLARIEFHAGDVQHAVPVATDREPRLLQHELPQAEIEQGQRRPGDDHLHLRQVEERARRRARGAAHPESVKDDFRIPAIPAGGEPIDLHRLLQLAREGGGEIVAVVFHVREHDEAHREQQHTKERHGDEYRHASDACDGHNGGR